MNDEQISITMLLEHEKQLLKDAANFKILKENQEALFRIVDILAEQIEVLQKAVFQKGESNERTN